MVKKFHLSVPKRNSNSDRFEPEQVREDLVRFPDKKKKSVYIGFRHKPSAIPPYVPVPNYNQYLDLVARYSGNPPITYTQYVDHRQMDRGRTIALGKYPRRQFIEKLSDNYYRFQEYRPTRYPNPFYDPNYRSLPLGERYRARYETRQGYEIVDRIVTWNGQLPLPDSSASNSSFEGRDSYIWAVYFLNNPIPTDEQWFPTPANYPEWNSFMVGEPVPDYDLSIL